MALNIGSGPYVFRYANQVVDGIEVVEVNMEEETSELETIQGQKIKRTKSRSVEVVATAVDTGITNLKKMVPDLWLANGAAIAGQPNGTTANNSDGIIAVGAPGTQDVTLQAELQLVPANDPTDHTITLFDALASLTDVQIDDGILKVEVTFRSEASGVQLTKGGVNLIS